MFHVIQDGYAIVRSKRGIHRQCRLYQYREGLYIGLSGGFVRLMTNGNVGTPDVSYLEISLPDGFTTTADSFGRLNVCTQ